MIFIYVLLWKVVVCYVSIDVPKDYPEVVSSVPNYFDVACCGHAFRCSVSAVPRLFVLCYCKVTKKSLHLQPFSGVYVDIIWFYIGKILLFVGKKTLFF